MKQRKQKEQEALKEYDVFISYARRDYVDEKDNVIPGNVVSKVKDALTRENVDFWFDEEGIFSSQDWAKVIVDYIEKAKVFVFLSTANANQSNMTSKEIAIACEFHKPIIPVRIDNSSYSKSVMFRIADLDYIEYYKNPDKGITDLVRSVNHCLKEIQDEIDRKRREEEEIKHKEQKEKEETEERLRKEQQQLIDEITKGCIVLNSEEGKLEIDRNSLLQKTELIMDEVKRVEISEHIKTSSPIYEKARNEFEQKAINSQSPSQNRKLYWIFGSIIFVLLVSVITALVVGRNKTDEWKEKYEGVSAEYRRITEKTKVEKLHIKDSSQGEFEYTGLITYDSLPIGNGKAEFINGDVFEGEFRNGVIIEGKYTWKDGGDTYVGPFIVTPKYE